MSELRETTVSELTPDARNANKGSERGLALLDKSLRQYGAGRSILIDKAGRVIAGNKTLERAADIGLDDVLVVQTDGTKLVAVQRTDLDLETDPKARELAYADNRVGEIDLSWDIEQLAADIEAGVDLSGLWSDGELADLIGDIAGDADAEPQIDKAEELRVKWGVETGQLWQLGEHRLICGDCTDKAVVERVMGGERADITITDPPYNVGKKYTNETNDNQSRTQFCEWCKLWAQYLPARYLLTVGIKHLLWWDDILGDPQWIIAWVKMNGSGQTGLSGPNKWDAVLAYNVGHDKLADVIEVNNNYQEGGEHPTSKPVKLWQLLLDRFGGSIVYEPFLGSGTMLIACENLRRKCRAVEISPAYCAVAIQRWVDVTGGEPVLMTDSDQS